MSILCNLGLHMHCLEGCGAMGDGILCLDCGQDKYPEAFMGYPKIIDTMGPKWWARARKVRNVKTNS